MIYGAGSLGTILGAFLTRAGVDIELVSRNKAHVEALNSSGAVILGNLEMKVPVRAITPDEISGEYDIVFLLTKQQDNDTALPFLRDHLSDNGILVTMQNGLPEPHVRDIIGDERTLGCTVEWGATMTGPGKCLFTSDPSPDKLSFQTGRPHEVPIEQFDAAVELLKIMGPVNVTDNFDGVRWSKLLVNATFAGLGTVMGGTFGDVTRDRSAVHAATACIKECIDVGHAAGIEFTDIQGFTVSDLFYYGGPVKRKIIEMILPFAMKKNGNIEPSMLQDLKKGKKCEVGFINGAVSEWGRRVGVKTPVNDMIIKIIRNYEAGILNISKDNLGYFKDC